MNLAVRHAESVFRVPIQRLDDGLHVGGADGAAHLDAVKRGKGNEIVTTPITNAVREILWPLRGHHPDLVFTSVANRGRGSARIKGRRYPITVSGLKTLWRRIRKAAGVSDFRFHDFRHDFGTKLLRKTGNLKLVQRALNHADIKTTTRHAHVLDDEVAAALDQLSESLKKSRSTTKQVG